MSYVYDRDLLTISDPVLRRELLESRVLRLRAEAELRIREREIAQARARRTRLEERGGDRGGYQGLWQLMARA